MNRKEYGRLLTKGEIGYYNSHLNAAKCFLQTGDPYGVILEDDAIVDDIFFDFLNAFSNIMWTLPTDLRIVNICNSAQASDRLLTTVRFHDSRFKLFRTLKFPTVARGLIYSRLGAEELLKYGSTISKPFDHFLKDWLTRRFGGYCLSTPVVGSAGLASDIGSGTSRKEQPLFEGLRYDWVVAKRDTLNDFHRLKRKFLTKNSFRPCSNTRCPGRPYDKLVWIFQVRLPFLDHVRSPRVEKAALHAVKSCGIFQII